MAIHKIKAFHEALGDFVVQYDDDVAHQFRYELRTQYGESWWYRYDEFWRELPDGPATTVDREFPVFTDPNKAFLYWDSPEMGNAEQEDINTACEQNVAIVAALDELRKL